MTDFRIVIRGRGRISAQGTEASAAFPAPSFRVDSATGLPVAALPEAAELALQELRRSRPAYRALDRSVLLALSLIHI